MVEEIKPPLPEPPYKRLDGKPHYRGFWGGWVVRFPESNAFYSAGWFEKAVNDRKEKNDG